MDLGLPARQLSMLKSLSLRPSLLRRRITENSLQHQQLSDAAGRLGQLVLCVTGSCIGTAPWVVTHLGFVSHGCFIELVFIQIGFID